MSTERWVRLIAGILVTLSVVLGWVHSPYWLLFTLILGLSLAQSALTEWCPMEKIPASAGPYSAARSLAAPNAVARVEEPGFFMAPALKNHLDKPPAQSDRRRSLNHPGQSKAPMPTRG